MGSIFVRTFTRTHRLEDSRRMEVALGDMPSVEANCILGVIS